MTLKKIINKLKFLEKITQNSNRVMVAEAPGGYDSLILAELAGIHDVIFIARDGLRMASLAESLAFFAPGLEVLEFPAWDCLPYDRVSPNQGIAAKRIDALTRLLEPRTAQKKLILLTTASAFLQKVAPRSAFAKAAMRVAVGDNLDMDHAAQFLVLNGYARSEMVMEPGEFAVRGGILDVFPGGALAPMRIDFFGDKIESIRVFDCLSQRTEGKAESMVIKPVSEVLLTDEATSRFRTGYRQLFGAPSREDSLYEAISAGRRHLGMEHWLALFYEHLETLIDYAPKAVLALDHQCAEACEARLDMVAEYYQARAQMAGGGAGAKAPPYHPLQSGMLHLDKGQWQSLLAEKKVYDFSPFSVPESSNAAAAGGKQGRDFADARKNPDVNLFDVLAAYIRDQIGHGLRVMVAAFDRGSRERLAKIMGEHGIKAAMVDEWRQANSLAPDISAVAVLGLEQGFTAQGLCVISEQDILGERMVSRSRRKARAQNFISDVTSLCEGDLVTHVDHGVARYGGLINIQVDGAAHDCLMLFYQGDDKLLLPVENINLIGRYGSHQAAAQLDRLGGAAWQARKAKMKRRLQDMAEELIKIAAARVLYPAAAATIDAAAFDEFCARFPYDETDDQRQAIDDVVGDLCSGTLTDRLVCGDVGFGKTEVALRAAFICALSGKQVAIVAPTTLLCRQHFSIFKERFSGFPVRIEQLSRMVSASKAKEVKESLAKGLVDIVIGTHALLAKGISFRELGLLVIDEEQRFGVAHKERLKKMKSNAHVLTLTATPIPRTLQMALCGVREMSIIASPPVDRLAVRTFILPYDPVIIREALLREQYRGGQSFYVCPRIEHMEDLKRQLADLTPELKMAIAHGRLAAKELEDVMSAFYDGAFDVLLSSNIIESGLDMPSVNTIIIHRADLFGLSQLYQLRGRVGRSKIRAYAYLTLPPRQKLSASAEKRLQAMQTLDALGSGFILASHDLDIRGAGNLLGGEQSGHVHEVGVELYQQMLEEAVAAARGVEDSARPDHDWNPQISLGMPVMIPESYVADLNLRLDFYRRIASLATPAEIDGFAAEMIDRFGTLPAEVENLLQTVAIKRLCMDASVAKVDAGPKGALLSFHKDSFANPQGLVAFITANAGTVKLRPDHRLVYKRDFEDAEARLSGIKHLLGELCKIASAAP